MADQGIRRKWLQWGELSPWLAGGLVALTLSWTADGMRECFEAWWLGDKAPERWKVLISAGYGVLCVLAVWWLYRVHHRFFPPRTRFIRNEVPEKRAHLVLFLSNLHEQQSPLHEGIPTAVTLQGDFEHDLSALVAWKKVPGQRWPWEMPLRSLQHHLGTLQSITVLCSPQSIQQVHWFGQLLGRYPALHGVALSVFICQEQAPPILVPCPHTRITEGGWDFEQFDALSEAMMSLLREFARRKIRDQQVMVDFTGGQKVTSVVATSITFNRAIKAQYVQTNPPHAVISYDILLGSADTGGLGL